MVCDNALQLVMEAQRSQQTSNLRPYADDTVRNVGRECRMFGAQLDAAREHAPSLDDDGAICHLSVAALSMKRNKRCLLAYHAQRIDMLKEKFWESATPHSLLSPERAERANLSPGEVDFVRAYANLVTQYKGAYVDSLDIASPSLERPPRDLYVQVRVLKDVGQVVGEWGILDLKKNDLLSLVRPQVERLIVAGVLEEIEF